MFKNSVPRRIRRKAIWYCFYFGVLPWWVYEKSPHYRCGYLYHLWINIHMALRWAFFLETQNDIYFEKTVNKNF
jgi:hypothetical protein